MMIPLVAHAVIDKGCWATLELSVGNTLKLNSQYDNPNGTGQIEWYLYQGTGTEKLTSGMFCDIISRDGNSCYIKGKLSGSEKVYCEMTYGNTHYIAYYTIIVTNDKPGLAANPASGEVAKGTVVKLYYNGKGAELSWDNIYYTLDGSNANVINGKSYTYNGIVIDEDCTLRARGQKWNGASYDYSDELVETYTIKKEKLTLSASPYSKIGNTIDAGTTIYLTTPNVSGADIYYTLNGIEPTEQGIRYTSSGITINESCILKAIAYKEGYETSNVLTRRFAINQNISINETNFPDENFRNGLLSRTYGQDGIIDGNEILNQCTQLSLTYANIQSLKGIEFFALLQDFACSGNKLISLDLSKNIYLETLECSYSQITSIDVSKNILLSYLSCFNNKLSSLDVSKNTALISLNCSGNHLTFLDLSQNTALTRLQCNRNQIKGKAMDELINSLPYNSTDKTYDFYVISPSDDNEGNVCTKSQVAAAKAKGWTPKYWDGSSWQEYEGSLDLSTCAEVIVGVDGEIYRVSGVVRNITNTTYGNWHLVDETGEIFIYGTLDIEGKTKNFSSLGIKEGDAVTVEGPRKTYNGIIELVDVTVIDIQERETYHQGDVNMDNGVNGTDLVDLSNIVLGRKEKTETADVNMDDSVNGTDIVALSNIILGRSNMAPGRAPETRATLLVEPFDIKAIETKKMLIDLANPNDEVTLVQFDLHLPAGLSIKKDGSDLDFDMAGRTSWRKHTLDANEVDGGYRFLLYSSSNTLIEGASEAIIKVNIVADESYNGGKIVLDNILLVDSNEKEMKPASYEYEIGSDLPISGDANGDGEVNITDITYIIDKINDMPAANFNKKAADLNEDGEINITDVTLLLDIINGVK